LHSPIQAFHSLNCTRGCSFRTSSFDHKYALIHALPCLID